MKKQLPPGVFTLAVVAAVLACAVFIAMSTGDPSVGKPAPDFQTKTADGKPFRLSDLKGKVVLINFWATWCGPCAKEIPELVALQQKYAARGFTVVGVSEDKNPKDAADFAVATKMNYPVVMQTDTAKSAYGGIPALPTTFILDKNGNIVFVQEGYAPGVVEQFAKEIEKRL